MSQPEKKLDFLKIKKSLHPAWDKVTSHPKTLLAVGFVVILAVCLIFLLAQSKSTESKRK